MVKGQKAMTFPNVIPAIPSIACLKRKTRLHPFIPANSKKPAGDDPWQLKSYEANPGDRVMKLQMRTDQYFAGEEGVLWTGKGFGNMMHLVFSRISSTRDVDPVLDNMEKEGMLSTNQRPMLQEKIIELISGSGVKAWFSEAEGRVIHNERSILCGDGRVVRPDRVIEDIDGVTVVDFKFGLIEKQGYRDQLLNYMEQLKRMEYDHVTGYMWYAMLDKIIQVEMT